MEWVQWLAISTEADRQRKMDEAYAEAKALTKGWRVTYHGPPNYEHRILAADGTEVTRFGSHLDPLYGHLPLTQETLPVKRAEPPPEPVERPTTPRKPSAAPTPSPDPPLRVLPYGEHADDHPSWKRVYGADRW